MLTDIDGLMFIGQLAAIAKANEEITRLGLFDRRLALGMDLGFISLRFGEHARLVLKRYIFVKVRIARADFTNKTLAVLRMRETFDAFDESLRASRTKHESLPEMRAAYVGAGGILGLVYLHYVLEFKKALRQA